MARKIKIDNVELKRRSQTETRRKVGGLPLRKYFLIVCEGTETEPNYFRQFKKKLPIGVVDCIEIEGEGKNTLSLMEMAAQHRTRKEAVMNGRKFDFTWAVFDKDDFPSEHFDNAINKGAQMQRAIHCAWSNEAFELWYLLHLEFINAPMSRNGYKSRIEKWLTERMGQPFLYEKNRADLYDILQRYGDENMAIQRAIRLEASFQDKKFSTHNPCTTVYRLVQALQKLLPQK
jgi:hypothetical protein